MLFMLQNIHIDTFIHKHRINKQRTIIMRYNKKRNTTNYVWMYGEKVVHAHKTYSNLNVTQSK